MRRSLAFLVVLLVLVASAGLAEARDSFLYFHDSSDQEIHIFRLDKKTGVPTELPTSPVEVAGGGVNGGAGQTLSADPKGEFLFAGTGTGLAVLRPARDGTVTEVAGSPFGGPGAVLAVSAWRKGKTLMVYALQVDPAELHIYRIDVESGAATRVGDAIPMRETSDPVGLMATKRHLFAVDRAWAEVHAFAIAKDGSLTPAPDQPFTFPDIADPRSFVTDAKGRTAIVNDDSSGGYGIARVHKKTGALSDFDTIASPSGHSRMIGFSKKGRFYGAGDGGIDVYNLLTGVLTTVLVGHDTDAGILDLRARHLYLIQHDILYHYTLDKKTGLPGLTPITTLPGTFEGDITGHVIL